MALEAALHDEIDALEEILESAGTRAESIIRERLRDVLRETDDPLLAMALVAREVEDKVVTDDTTAAFQRFADLAQRRTV